MSISFQNQLEKFGVHEQIYGLANECIEKNELIDKKTAEIIKSLKAILDNSSENDQKEICKIINKKFPRLVERVEEIKGIEERIKSFKETLGLVIDKKSEIEEVVIDSGIADSKLTDELIELCRDVEIENERIASLYIECFEKCHFINNNYETIKGFLDEIKNNFKLSPANFIQRDK